MLSIQKAYKRYAKSYNFFFGWIFHPGRATAVELLQRKPGHRILEVGVGTGLSLELYPRHVRVVGIDVSREMLDKAIEYVEKEKLVQVESLKIMDAENMTFEDSSFDSVVAMYVATVVPNPRKFISEMKRVCKPNGQIVLLNHFSKTDGITRRLNDFISPLSKYLGFRPNLTFEDFMVETGLIVDHRITVNVFDLWTILISTNEK